MITAVVFLSAAVATSAARSAASPIKIGLIAPLTGAYAVAGEGNVQGVTLAVQDINRTGGIHGQKIQLITENDETNAAQGVTAFYKLQSAGVAGFIGPLDNTSASAVAPLAERAGIPMIAPTSDPPIIEPAKQYVFETVPVPKYFGLPLVEYLKATGIKRIAVAYDTTTNFSTVGYSAMAAAAKSRGMSVVAAYPYQVTNTDFSPMLTKLRSTTAQALVVWGGGPAPIQLTKQFAATGLKSKMQLVFTVVEASLPDFVKPAGSAAEGAVMDANRGLIASYLPASAPFTKQVAALTKEYKKKYHANQAPQFVTDAYAAGQVLFTAMRHAKSTSHADIAAALNHLNVLTVDGHYHFTPKQHGDVTDLANLAMVKVVNGQFVPTTWEKKRIHDLPHM